MHKSDWDMFEDVVTEIDKFTRVDKLRIMTPSEGLSLNIMTDIALHLIEENKRYSTGVKIGKALRGKN